MHEFAIVEEKGSTLKLVKWCWRTFVPERLRRLLSDLRHLEAIRSDLEKRMETMREEVDELRADQRRVAELMDVVEQLALDLRKRA